MPKLWKFLTKEESEEKTLPKVQDYKFEDTDNLMPDFSQEPEETMPDAEEELPEEIPQEPEKPTMETDPLGFAKVEAEIILQDARNQAETILEQARQQAESQRKAAQETGQKEGYAQGYQEGHREGTAKAMEEASAIQEKLETEFAGRIDAFSKSAERALTHQLNENLSGMTDLAIAVAEKVVSVSLRSSRDVISKMIQAAVDKRKRREWVHIYISEKDAAGMTALPPALAGALAELSDHVRIIPMADDESGTCIVEFPDEIIDASASTQIQNIRELLNAQNGKKQA